MANFKNKTKLQADAGILLPQEAVSRVLTTDGAGDIKSSSVTTTTLAFLDATSSIQGQLDDKASQLDLIDAQEQIDALVLLSGLPSGSENLGTSAGTIISDDASIKEALDELQAFVEALPEPIVYKGTYNASTNTPALANTDTGVTGFLYRVVVAGTHDFGAGPIELAIGDSITNNGTIWEKWDHSDQVNSVNGQTGAVQLDAVNIPYDNTASGLIATELQGAVDELNDKIDGLPAAYITSVTDSASIDLTVTAGALIAAALPAGIDHDALLNYVANDHIDHSTVLIDTQANSGLTGGGDITTTRALYVDIIGTTAETVASNADLILIFDDSVGQLRSMSRANFLAGLGAPGDIAETSFSAANNQAALANVTGLAFANGVVRSFDAMVSVYLDATTDAYETFSLRGIQKGASWDMSVTSVGDASGVDFDITSSGQVQYSSGNAAGFTSLTLKFRAITLSV